MQLQQRLASGSQASCSYAARALSCSTRRPAPAVARREKQTVHRSRLRQVCRAVDYDEAEETEVEEHQDTVYERMVDFNNIYPDYEDEEWVSKVTNWEEFWYESEDVLDLDDEDSSSLEQGIESLQRAQQLIGQLGSLRKRTDVEQMIGPRVRPPNRYDESYTSEYAFAEEEVMHRMDPNPDWNVIDVRALAEKRRHRATLDEEWQRQAAQLARPFSFTLRLDNDVRLESANMDWIREEWSHEQIMDMIVGGGKFVHPDKIPAVVMNPLLPADYAEAGVRCVPDTEDFIEAIGHMATADEILHLQSEVALSEADFVDPSLVFEDPDNNIYMQAPVNPWAQMIKARDAADVEMFEQLVDRMTERQQRKEALAAAQAEAGQLGDESAAAAAGLLEGGAEGAGVEEEDEEAVVDGVLGEGFSEFMDDDEGIVFYDDLEEDEDEGEEGEAEWQEGEQQG